MLEVEVNTEAIITYADIEPKQLKYCQEDKGEEITAVKLTDEECLACLY